MSKVINFHDVNDAAWFESVVVYLKSRYTMVKSKALIDYYYKGKPLKNACLITVDDGALSSYEVIYPVLKKHNVPAIFFVSPLAAERTEKYNFWFQEMDNYDEEKLKNIFDRLLPETYNNNLDVWDNLKTLNIDTLWQIIDTYQHDYSVATKPPQNMTVDQILQIDREGLVEIGAHTMWHPLLSRESAERSEYEIKESIKGLERVLEHKIATFAYPNGRKDIDFTEREYNILKNTDIKLAFSTQARDMNKTDNRMAVPRYGLTCGSLKFIAIKLTLGKYYKPLAKVLRSIKNTVR